MANILLIHGSGHGAWCWRDLVPALQARGHQAFAMDLPSHGDDLRDPRGVTLDDYARAIVAAVRALDMPIYLLGHSAGGAAITRAADLLGTEDQQLKGLIYLCAYVPAPGLRDQSIADLRKSHPSQPLKGAFRVSEDGLTFTFDPTQVEARFYHDCGADVARWAAAQLGPQPILPQETHVDVPAHVAGLPSAYLTCANDRVIPPDLQNEMADRLNPTWRSTLDAGHSPFLSMPQDLAAALSDAMQACA